MTDCVKILHQIQFYIILLLLIYSVYFYSAVYRATQLNSALSNLPPIFSMWVETAEKFVQVRGDQTEVIGYICVTRYLFI